MCGINGFNYKDENLIKKMMSFTRNRGPDFKDFVCEENISLGHDRLSILDLNSRSNQPFKFNHLILSFNGEIYNYKDLRKKLENLNYSFKTTSDTEVVIYLFNEYGIESFKMLSGIFAISIWDNKSKILYLIRDIVGVKPLFYSFDSSKNIIHFSSSIKSLLINIKNREINDKALFFFKNIGRNDDKETFFKGIYKLLPGELLIQKKNQKLQSYKFLEFKIKRNYLDNDPKNTISNIIKSQFVSDVPIALSLSGGVDSNIIYYVMRNNLPKSQYNIYSFFFNDHNKFNEDFKIAKKNCESFNDKINPVEIRYQDFSNNIEEVSDILEEPLGNQSAILNYIMAKKINQKVIMTGDGGDEIFGGYDHYRSAYLLSIISKLNFFKYLKKKIKFNNKNLNRIFFKDSREFFLSFNEGNLMKDKSTYYKNFVEMQVKDLCLNHGNNYKFSNRLNDISFLDLDTKIQNDFMRRNDSIFMNFGIEARVPFLDERMINNYLYLDENIKFNNSFKSKGFLKKYFGNEFSTVKGKWGLQSPIAKWMKKELQPFLKEVLSKNFYYNSSHYLNFEEIEKLLKLHKEKYFNPELIWTLVSFQFFIKKYKL
jgi:asparagine synthase (glutamine-hydrolysing)